MRRKRALISEHSEQYMSKANANRAGGFGGAFSPPSGVCRGQGSLRKVFEVLQLLGWLKMTSK